MSIIVSVRPGTRTVVRTTIRVVIVIVETACVTVVRIANVLTLVTATVGHPPSVRVTAMLIGTATVRS